MGGFDDRKVKFRIRTSHATCKHDGLAQCHAVCPAQFRKLCSCEGTADGEWRSHEMRRASGCWCFEIRRPLKWTFPLHGCGATRWSRNAALSADRLTVSRVESPVGRCRQCLSKGARCRDSADAGIAPVISALLRHSCRASCRTSGLNDAASSVVSDCTVEAMIVSIASSSLVSLPSSRSVAPSLQSQVGCGDDTPAGFTLSPCSMPTLPRWLEGTAVTLIHLEIVHCLRLLVLE